MLVKIEVVLLFFMSFREIALKILFEFISTEEMPGKISIFFSESPGFLKFYG